MVVMQPPVLEVPQVGRSHRAPRQVVEGKRLPGLFRTSWVTAVIRLLLLTCILATGNLHAQSNEFRAFWVDAFGGGFKNASQVTTLISDIRAANANAIVPEIRKRGDAYYSGSPFEPKATDISPSSFDPLQDMINKAHDTTGGKERIEVHAWIVSYKIWGNQFTPPGASTPPHPYNAHPEWLMPDVNGDIWDGTSYSFDPGHPEVQRYTYNLCMDIISRYDIDGFNFDYIRYPGSTWGYHPVTVARFNAQYGRTGQPSPTDAEWKQFRRDQVTALVRKVYLNTMAIKPWVKISADTITHGASGVTNDAQWYSSSSAWNSVLQDWRGWMEEGILDLNIPMTYYRHHNTTPPNDHATAFTNWMNFAKDRRFNRHVAIGPGIYLNYTSNSIIQMRATRDASPMGNYADGLCCYVYKQPDNQGTSFSTFKTYLTSSPNAHDPLSPALFDQAVSPPDMPWKTSPVVGHLMGTIFNGTLTNALDGAQVTLTGPVHRTQTNDATGFYGFVDLPPGSYVVEASFPGYIAASANITVSAGAVATRDLDLPVGPPEIVAQPSSLSGYVGTAAAFSVSASGVPPLHYQWHKNGATLPDSTNATHLINTLALSDAGGYDVVITNAFGSVTSIVATLTVLEPDPGQRLVPLWELSPGDRSYLTTGNTERGLSYNPANGNLLLVSRSGSPTVHVLNSVTGIDLHTLNNGAGIISGGVYTLNLIGVADDGAVYVCNLTTDGSASALKIYRWANDTPSTPPTVAYNGSVDGSANRWGDTLDVRGAGAGTQLLLGSRSGTTAVVLTTANGTTFTATPIAVSGGQSGMFGLGIAFGAGDTFWGKATSLPLRQIGFNLGAGTGSVIQAFGSPPVASSMMAIGVNPDDGLLGGVVLGAPDYFQLYDLPAVGAPSVIESNDFPTDNPNSNGTGAVDFGDDQVFALDSNNGILAMSILPPQSVPVILTQPASQTVRVGSNVTFAVEAEGFPEPSYQWRFDGANIGGATGTNYTLVNALPDDGGNYSVVVFNAAGGGVSSNALLTVNPWAELRFESITRLPDGRMQLEISGESGEPLWLEQAFELPHWLPLTNIAMSNSLVEFTDDDATNQPIKKYRAHQ